MSADKNTLDCLCMGDCVDLLFPELLLMSDVKQMCYGRRPSQVGGNSLLHTILPAHSLRLAAANTPK